MLAGFDKKCTAVISVCFKKNQGAVSYLFTDDHAGGTCKNEGEECEDEDNAICTDGCCVCKPGFTRIEASCVAGNPHSFIQ